MSDLPTSAEKLAGETSEQTVTAELTPRRWLRRMGLVMLLLAGLLAWYLLISYAGWRSGQNAREVQQAADLASIHDRQLALARQDVEQGNYALALLRLDWILERSPDDSDALAMRQEAQLAQDMLMTPQASATPTASPTPQPSPTATLVPVEDPAAELARIEELIALEAWEDAVVAMEAFQWHFPSFRRTETDEMLYDAYIGVGLELIQGEQIELGLSYLEKAERLGDLPPAVTDYRTWAELYLQGIAFYNVNWGATIFYFRDLCLAAPFFQSSCDTLFEALVAYGDQYAAGLEWCPAQELYAEAFRLNRTQALAGKLNSAREACLLATPTPEIPSPGPSITGSLQITSPFSILPPALLITPTP